MFRTRIRQHEVGLRFRHGNFAGIVRPGTYLDPRWLFRGVTIEVFDTLVTRFEHERLDVLVRDPDIRNELEVVELIDDQRAFLWKDGRLEAILGPGRHAFWKRPYDLRVEVHDVSGARFVHPRMEAVLAHADAAHFLQGVHCGMRERVLFFRDGELIDTLNEGVAVFWRQVAGVTWKVVDLREQVADVTGQEIMTGDKVSLRVNLLVTYRVEDATQAITSVDDYRQSLYREAQLALRAAVGARALDNLLADKQAVGDEVRDMVASRVTEFGIAVKGVGLRDLILPGDMKTILNQVIEAQKRAEANLIRRREETAAARSQANTARLLAENPALARMKELEALQEILAGTKATFLFGQTDLVRQVRSLTEPVRENGDDDVANLGF
jgi:regulator of protease activity HflC (stomatin/prohibitin superfamily)